MAAYGVLVDYNQFLGHIPDIPDSEYLEKLN